MASGMSVGSGSSGRNGLGFHAWLPSVVSAWVCAAASFGVATVLLSGFVTESGSGAAACFGVNRPLSLVTCSASNSSALGLGLGLAATGLAALAASVTLAAVFSILPVCFSRLSLTASLTLDRGLGRWTSPALTPLVLAALRLGPALVCCEVLLVDPLAAPSVESAWAVPWPATAIAAPTPAATATPPM